MRSAKIESGRAEFALSEVKRVKESKDGTQKEYKSYCRKFPSIVQTNGLAASVAFLKEKSKDKDNAYNHLYTNIARWLMECKLLSGDIELMTYICELETPQYRIVTKEVLALFNWLRRFASGLIEGEV